MASKPIYEETPHVLELRFNTPGLDLRDIGIASTALHRAITDAIIAVYAPNIPGIMRAGARIRSDDPLFISLAVEELRHGSFLAKCRLKISPELLRELAVGTTASLIATAIWSIGAAATHKGAASPPPPAIVEMRQVPDVGPGVRAMVRRLSDSGKPWELTLRDERSGYEVTIRSHQTAP